MLDLKVVRFKLNYHPLSSDMEMLVDRLMTVRNEDIFNTQAIQLIITHLWKSTWPFFVKFGFLFLAMLVLLSVYVGIKDNHKELEIVIFCFSAMFLVYEVIQLWMTGVKLWLKNSWKVIDMLYEIALMTTIISIWSGLEDDLSRKWLKSLLIIFGYMKLLFYLRIFQQMSKWEGKKSRQEIFFKFSLSLNFLKIFHYNNFNFT